MGRKIEIVLESIYGITGSIFLDEDVLGDIDEDLANTFASAVAWSVNGVIGNAKMQRIAELQLCQCEGGRH